LNCFHQFDCLFDANDKKEHFIRIEPYLNLASSWDDTFDKIGEAIKQAAIKFVKDNPEKINNLVDKLISNKPDNHENQRPSTSS